MRHILPPIAVLLAACSVGPGSSYSVSAGSGDGPVIRGSGQAAIVERDVPAFHSIVSRGPVDVDVVVGADGPLELEGDGLILEHLRTEVEEGVLTIDFEPGRYRFEIPMRATVRAASIKDLTNTGSGDMAATDLSGEAVGLTLTLTGSGELTIRRLEAEAVSLTQTGSGSAAIEGRADHFRLSLTGSGDCDAADLVARHVHVSQTGSGSASVHADASVEAGLTGSGDLWIHGEPEEEATVATGSGKIRRR